MLRTKGEPGKGGFWILDPDFEREPTPPQEASLNKPQRSSTKKIDSLNCSLNSGEEEKNEEVQEITEVQTKCVFNEKDQPDFIQRDQSDQSIPFSNLEIAQLLPEDPNSPSLSNATFECDRSIDASTPPEPTTIAKNISHSPPNTTNVDNIADTESLKIKVIFILTTIISK